VRPPWCAGDGRGVRVTAEAPVFTGERLPGDDPNFRADLARHLAAYHLARPYCAGKSVLDAGCGEGYGSGLLAGVAARVVGVDRDRPALAHARARYGRDDVLFVCADLERLGALRARFDVVCNFQVIEHLEAPERLLRELGDRLVPGGRLVLTTPNRETSFSPNPYHVREYSDAELGSLLRPHFSAVEVRGVAVSERMAAYEAARRKRVERLLRLDPLGLRTRLPAPLVRWAFARLARLVRTQVARDGVGVEIEPGDFVDRPTADGAIDLLAICTR